MLLVHFCCYSDNLVDVPSLVNIIAGCSFAVSSEISFGFLSVSDTPELFERLP
jgi:hypothetical protein